MAVYDSVSIPWPGWHITAELGEGGYGKVYRIERMQSGITEAAALKVISIPKSKSEYDAVRFSMDTEDETKTYFENRKENVLKEIKTMQSLKGCANIVSIDDWAVTEKKAGPGWDIYIRMELLTTMTAFLMDNSVDEKHVIKLGADICTALEQCEKKGFIHRDIKPGNILVNSYGDYKLADFGIARELDHTTFVTGVGTPSYMSPEVHNGDNADRTVDLYSLGLVMYELLNDRRLPFVQRKYSPRDEQAALSRRMNGEAIPAPANGGSELKKTVLKACAFEPKDRYRSAREMKNDLESVSRGDKAVIAGKDAGKKSKSKSVYWIAGTVAVMLIGMIMALSSGGGDTGSAGTSTEDPGVTYTETTDSSSSSSDSAETSADLNEEQLKKTVEGTWQAEDGYGWTFSFLKEGTGSAEFYGPDPEGSEMISWVINDGIIEIHSGNQRIEGTLFLYDNTEDVMWLDGEKGTVKYIRKGKD